MADKTLDKRIAVCSSGFHWFSVITFYCLSFSLYRVLGLDYSTMFVMYMIGAVLLKATESWTTMSFLGLIGEIKILSPTYPKLLSSFEFDVCFR